MKEKQNIILTMVIAGGLAAMGAGMFYLTGFEQWQTTASSVPAMGFNGIAAAFLGGLNPIGAIFSSYFIQHITNGGATWTRPCTPPRSPTLSPPSSSTCAASCCSSRASWTAGPTARRRPRPWRLPRPLRTGKEGTR